MSYRRRRYNKPSVLDVYYQNIHSLRTKIQEVRYFAAEFSPSLMCFAETWVKYNEAAPPIVGYRVAAHLTMANGYGGVTIYSGSDVFCNSA